MMTTNGVVNGDSKPKDIKEIAIVGLLATSTFLTDILTLCRSVAVSAGSLPA